MIVRPCAIYRTQYIINGIHQFIGQPPAGTEKQQTGPIALRDHTAHLPVILHLRVRLGRGRDQQRLFTGLFLDTSHRCGDTVTHRDVIQSTLSVGIIACAKAVLPMLQQGIYQLLLILGRLHQIIPFKSKRQRSTGNIVNVQIGDRGIDDLVLLIIDRIMDQRKPYPGALGTLGTDGIQHTQVLIGKTCLAQQLRPSVQCTAQTLLPPPAAYMLVVALLQHLRHLHPVEFRRAGVLRILQQILAEALLLAGFIVSQRPRQQTDHRIRHNHRRQLAACQYIITDRIHIGSQCILDPLVYALVMAADENDLLGLAQLLGGTLIKNTAGRAGNDDTGIGRAAQILHRLKKRLGLHHHTGTAAIELVIRQPVLGAGIITDILDIQLHQTFFGGTGHDAVLQRCKHLREKCQYIYTHHSSSPSGIFTYIRPVSSSTFSMQLFSAGSSISGCLLPGAPVMIYTSLAPVCITSVSSPSRVSPS